MPLTLLVGPANAGKVAGLLDRYVAALDRDPFLVVPNRAEVERVERDLLVRVPVLLGGSVGTFDDLFRRVTGRVATAAPALLSPAQRALVVARVISRTTAPAHGCLGAFRRLRRGPRRCARRARGGPRRPGRRRRRPRRALRGVPVGAASASAPATSRPCGGGRRSSWRPISEHGTRPPSWSTASRT